MSKIEFRTFIDMLTVATPSSGYAIGYDLDGTLKQKDQFGTISPIGATGGIGPAGPTGIGVTGSSGPQGATGPSSATPSFAQVLAVDNNSGTYSIVMGTSSSIKSSNGNGQIDLDYDGTYSHVYITSDNGVLLESVLEVSNHYTGLAAKNYFMGFEAYDLGNERSTNLWSTFTSSIINIGVSKDYYSTYYEYQDIAVHENTTSVSVSDHNRHAIFIGTRNSSFSAGITNSVIIGGYSMSATVSNTIYLGNNVNINNAYTLPNTDGASGYVLKTDGSGIVTWQADTNTGYKVYKALISQSSTNAPTVTVLQNTIGDIVWTRDGVGVYLGTLANAFTANKTFLPQPSQNNSNKSIVLFRTGVNVIEIDTFDITNTLADSLLNENSICIEVYP